MSMDSISKLTVRQVLLIYFKERDRKTGSPKRINAAWDDENDSVYKQFIAMGLDFGRSLADLNQEWEAAEKDGNTSS